MIKEVIGLVLIGIGLWELYHFLIGEYHASQTWWCHVPIIGSLFCSFPNITTLVISIVFLAIGGILLLA
jgi:hypothetical protein